MKPITIKDIARELNISVSTVSRALQNHPDPAVQQAAEKIAQAAKSIEE